MADVSGTGRATWQGVDSFAKLASVVPPLGFEALPGKSSDDCFSVKDSPPTWLLPAALLGVAGLSAFAAFYYWSAGSQKKLDAQVAQLQGRLQAEFGGGVLVGKAFWQERGTAVISLLFKVDDITIEEDFIVDRTAPEAEDKIVAYARDISSQLAMLEAWGFKFESNSGYPHYSLSHPLLDIKGKGFESVWGVVESWVQNGDFLRHSEFGDAIDALNLEPQVRVDDAGEWELVLSVRDRDATVVYAFPTLGEREVVFLHGVRNAAKWANEGGMSLRFLTIPRIGPRLALDVLADLPPNSVVPWEERTFFYKPEDLLELPQREGGHIAETRDRLAENGIIKLMDPPLPQRSPLSRIRGFEQFFSINPHRESWVKGGFTPPPGMDMTDQVALYRYLEGLRYVESGIWAGVTISLEANGEGQLEYVLSNDNGEFFRKADLGEVSGYVQLRNAEARQDLEVRVAAAELGINSGAIEVIRQLGPRYRGMSEPALRAELLRLAREFYGMSSTEQRYAEAMPGEVGITLFNGRPSIKWSFVEEVLNRRLPPEGIDGRELAREGQEERDRSEIDRRAEDRRDGESPPDKMRGRK